RACQQVTTDMRGVDATLARLHGTLTGPPAFAERLPGENALVKVEPMTGIEPAYSAWEVERASIPEYQSVSTVS
ncbi:hypothetical protein RBA14_23325, partial [Mycobacteroides abscessus subsp. abscessus]|uniref:hypothetical protein n=1 Tax=Mycobacteroides abscessus TaxID=36809 RepID=UPI003CEEF200